ncbi:TRAP transporter permease [Halococcus qingdaonensis]|uniref:TRAP transporter permease n=1 Tax=Halococcus qingdaonensis TaxID=224402 RepID=UPI002116320E|nr:TRAP transporter fused permease subunit [Halococcus qingdaonensis]
MSTDTATDETGVTGDAAEDADELIDELERRRSLRGLAGMAVIVVAVAFSAYQLWLAARGFTFTFSLPLYGEINLGSLQSLQVNSIHVTFGLLLTFLLFPATQGDGFLSRRLARLVPILETRLGETNPVTRGARGVRGVIRWLLLDPDRERVTPVDILLIAVSILTTLYILLDFDEVQLLRSLGLDSGQTIAELVPALSTPVGALSAIGIPLDETSAAFVLGALGVLLVLEATRRTLGFYLMSIVGLFIVYARFGYLIPGDAPIVGVLGQIPQSPWSTVIQNLWYNTANGVFGVPVRVSVQFIYIFILFGAFLEMSGAGKWFIDLAYSVTGRRKGGPAKASILASGFMGMISGSSIANTVTTGAFTIPLMKKTGYRAEFSGAVEASASSGGQILPPVMGAAAFLIVEYTQTPFANVIVAAAIPAIVFFFGVWVMVHLEASRAGIGGVDASDLVGLRSHLRQGWFYLVPLVLLLYYLLVARLTVARSAWYTILAITALIAFVAAYNKRTRWPLVGVIGGLAIAEFLAHLVAGVGVIAALTGAGGAGMAPGAAAAAIAGKMGWLVIAVSFLTLLARSHGDAPLIDYDDQVDDAIDTVTSAVGRPQFGNNRAVGFLTFLEKAMESGARTATPVVIAVAAAGIIPGVISTTGLGPNLTTLILSVAGDSLVLLLVITAISSIILGMGMPTTVTYIILVSLLGPAISNFEVPLLAAHLFILYFGVIADITPPVAVAAYAASGVAKSDPFQTGIEAFSLSLNKAIVPFAFVLVPGVVLLRRIPGVPADADQVYRVIGVSDVLDVGYFVPEVLIPIVGVFLGVVALGATVIGFLYSEVSWAERAAFALTALLLMAPGLLFNSAESILAALGMAVSFDALTFDLALRAIGGVLFAALALTNRRQMKPEAERAEQGDDAAAEA